MTHYQPRIRTIEAVQLISENAAEVAASVIDGAVVDGGITFTRWGDPLFAPFGSYILNADGASSMWPAEDFEPQYELVPNPSYRERVNELQEAVDTLTNRIAALEGS